MSSININIGARIREERLRLTLSQAAFAAAGHVSKGTQVGYESGAHSPDAQYLFHIAKAGADTHYILSGEHTDIFVISNFNWNLLAEIIEEIKGWSIQNDLIIPAENREDLLRHLYSNFSKQRTIDPETMKTVLRLVK